MNDLLVHFIQWKVLALIASRSPIPSLPAIENGVTLERTNVFVSRTPRNLLKIKKRRERVEKEREIVRRSEQSFPIHRDRSRERKGDAFASEG